MIITDGIAQTPPKQCNITRAKTGDYYAIMLTVLVTILVQKKNSGYKILRKKETVFCNSTERARAISPVKIGATINLERSLMFIIMDGVCGAMQEKLANSKLSSTRATVNSY